jgi:UDP-N-acetylmuramate dehydrogenase
MQSIPYCLIGNGTNILFDDEGYRGCVIRMGSKFSNIKIEERKLTAQAGIWTPHLAKSAARAGLSGIEHTIGIPATFGGLIYMNGGSQRKGIGDIIERVKVLTMNGKLNEIPASDCEFSYRHSRFQNSGEIIMSATLTFKELTPYKQQRPELLKILRERRRKFPRKDPSCGSVFKSSPELYHAYGTPGEIIENLGFKGRIKGNIQVSPLHANFIVNRGSGSSADVLDLVKLIYSTVKDRTGLKMIPEFQYCHPTQGFLNAEAWL